jgi:hypothetical protein
MKKLILFIIVLIIVGAGAFWGGMKYQQNKISSQRTSFQNLSPEERQQRLRELGANAGAGFRGGAGNGQRSGDSFTAGEIISKDDKSITVKLRDGGSKIIFLSNSTEITKSTPGALSDLEVGKNIIVNGTANSDGSVIAQTIQLRSK